jgi:hypothetical protein
MGVQYMHLVHGYSGVTTMPSSARVGLVDRSARLSRARRKRLVEQYQLFGKVLMFSTPTTVLPAREPCSGGNPQSSPRRQLFISTILYQACRAGRPHRQGHGIRTLPPTQDLLLHHTVVLHRTVYQSMEPVALVLHQSDRRR